MTGKGKLFDWIVVNGWSVMIGYEESIGGSIIVVRRLILMHLCGEVSPLGIA